MAVQLSVAVRNAKLEAVETTIGTSGTLEIRSGAQPANCAAADSGTVLATVTLPADFMSDAASGVKSMLGSWGDLSADAAGTAGHFRIKASSICHMQGSVTATGGGGDITVSSVNFAVGQEFAITSMTWTEGNA